MKICRTCGQSVSREVTTCPTCGAEAGKGREVIDEYRILQVLHEGYSSILCRAVKEGTDEQYMIRIFTPDSGVDERVAERLTRELEKLRQLPPEYFVRHFEIRRSSDGVWYRVSEWVEAEPWGALLSSGRLQDYETAFGIFRTIASIIDGLHLIGHIIPHLILDDILIIKGEGDCLRVKIDYKLSRFLDPHMGRPSPMLKRLLTCHPDILNERVLDVRSDVWSLGKVYVEILSADPEVEDLTAAVKALPLPGEVAALLNVMLAEDPDLRPPSMADVVSVFSRVTGEDIRDARSAGLDAAPARGRDVRGLKRWVMVLAAVLVLCLAGVSSWYYFGSERKPSEDIFIEYAMHYAPSVAFVMVDYLLLEGEQTVYRNRTEGTAFLVDDEGYLLTNRHVACPWLEDDNLHLIVDNRPADAPVLRLDYRIFLWFEGERAFNRLPDLSAASQVEDIYFVESAYRTDGTPRLGIAGVAKTPVKTSSLMRSPLKDDFAVLRIEEIPEGLIPLRLDPTMDPRGLSKLSPVITLGFPLGSRTQATTVNVSVTRGHVRRTFEDMFQVDTSIHRGNSGGPIIDIHGKVIGIASAVVVDWASAPMPVVTPLSDIGLVLPIGKSAGFIEDLKRGLPKWSGVLDLSVDRRLESIRALARRRLWEEARSVAEKESALSDDPKLVTAAGMMCLCAGDPSGSRRFFDRALSMDNDDNLARFMRFMVDTFTNREGESPHLAHLRSLDWKSPDEFLGYLTMVLSGKVDEGTALKAGYSHEETAWLTYCVGLARSAGPGDVKDREALFERAVLGAEPDGWLFLIALADLDRAERRLTASLRAGPERERHTAQVDSRTRRITDSYESKIRRRQRLAPLLVRLTRQDTGPEGKRQIAGALLAESYREGDALVGLTYYSAMTGRWEEALTHLRAFIAVDGRDNADRLSVGILEAGILHMMGRKNEALKTLEDYYLGTDNGWFVGIAECLLGRKSEEALLEEAGASPEAILTAHMTLGFWAEGSGHASKAVKHYREALGSYADNRIEYEFVRERIKTVRSRPG